MYYPQYENNYSPYFYENINYGHLQVPYMYNYRFGDFTKSIQKAAEKVGQQVQHTVEQTGQQAQKAAIEAQQAAQAAAQKAAIEAQKAAQAAAQKATQQVVQEVGNQTQQWVQDVQQSDLGKTITSFSQNITSLYNQIRDIQKMFRPCATPPGYTNHDNLIRRISIFGQTYSVIVRICYPISIENQIRAILNRCNYQAQQSALQAAGVALASGAVTSVGSIPIALQAALTSYQNTFLSCVQNPQASGIQFSIFIN
ncbi:hypothetical protein ABEX44_15385 [Priestia megaterium]